LVNVLKTPAWLSIDDDAGSLWIVTYLLFTFSTFMQNDVGGVFIWRQMLRECFHCLV